MSFEILDIVDPWRLRRLLTARADSLLPSPLPITAAALDGSWWLPALVAGGVAGASWYLITHARPGRAPRARAQGRLSR